MQSESITRGCAPADNHPLIETVAHANDIELAAIYAFWQAQPDAMNVRALAIGIIERAIVEHISLAATEVLTPAQQRRVLTFARRAPTTIHAFEHFYIVIDSDSGTVWIVYHERQHGRSQAHALQIDAEGSISDSIDGAQAEALSQRSIVNIIPLLAEDGSDTMVFTSFKPPLTLPGT